MKRLHNLVMVLVMVFAQLHAQMVVKVNARGVKEVVKMVALVVVHESVQVHVVAAVDKDVRNLVLLNAR